MECRENLGGPNNLKQIEREACVVCALYLRWTPAIENPTQSCLFRVVGNMRSKTIDHATEVSVGTLNDVGVCHEGF
jgi:hypothetical protein